MHFGCEGSLTESSIHENPDWLLESESVDIELGHFPRSLEPLYLHGVRSPTFLTCEALVQLLSPHTANGGTSEDQLLVFGMLEIRSKLHLMFVRSSCDLSVCTPVSQGSLEFRVVELLDSLGKSQQQHLLGALPSSTVVNRSTPRGTAL
eukprot:m.49586 g.49586  ORF g.49586 m.49586 type:complete len:149 (+) comp8966_c0_seq1:877-1323(+)